MIFFKYLHNQKIREIKRKSEKEIKRLTDRNKHKESKRVQERNRERKGIWERKKERQLQRERDR